nr:response regulator [Chthoniobacterales bacterium]
RTRPGLRLLVVEDHESTLQVLSRLLTRAGHSVVAASNLSEALVAAGKGEFDLVISDLGLPDGTGNELMEILRARHTLRGIALSGYGMEEDIARSRQAGFSTHLTKPIDFPQLQRALREVTDGDLV